MHGRDYDGAWARGRRYLCLFVDKEVYLLVGDLVGVLRCAHVILAGELVVVLDLGKHFLA